MAYDPEARQQSNSAMIIGIVALVLLVVGALAYYSTQNTRAEAPTTSTTVVNPPAERVEVVPVPANPAPPVVVERQVPVPVTPPTRVIERDTHTTVTRDRVVTPPASGSSATPRTSTNTNVTVNVPSTPSRTTSQPQAGSDAGTGTTSDTTTTDTATSP